MPCSEFERLFHSQPHLILLAQIQHRVLSERVSLGRRISLIFSLYIRPLNANLRVIPSQAALIIVMIKVIALITEFRFVAQDEEAVRKSLRNQELLFVLRRQRHAIPFSICFGFRSQIHRHIKYSAAHHANEWITTPLLMKYLETLLRAAAAGETVFGYPAEDILFRAALTFVPLVDPDGVDLVTGALPEGEAKERTAAIAAAFPGIPYPDGWKANIAGIDLNLQYPAGWDTARAIKFAQGYDRPAPRDFVGEAPLTAPEAAALAARMADFPHTALKGLMAIPPVSEFPGENCRYFAEMRNLFVDISAKKYDNVSMECLSMGMSDDFADAIAEGSTMVRIGTAIFGKRNYNV